MGISRWNQWAACWQISRELLETAVCLQLMSPSLTPSCSASLPAWSSWMCWWTPKRGISASAKEDVMEKGVWKSNTHQWGKWGYWSSWFPNKRSFTPEGSSDPLRWQVQEKFWTTVALTRGQRGHWVPQHLMALALCVQRGPCPSLLLQ